MYILERTQTLPVSETILWQFIQDPANLDTITPPDLQFSIVSRLPDKMYNGLIVEYQLRVPVFGRQKWVTEIKHIRENFSFVDEQRLGPYRFWYHYHEIRPTDGDGTSMIDRVHYQLPYGLVGKGLHAIIIHSTLQRIFDYRQQRLMDLFK